MAANRYPAEGAVDLIEGPVAIGWAYDADAPGRGVVVRFYVDGPVGKGRAAGETTTDIERTDIGRAGNGRRPYGFVYRMPEAFHDGRAHRLWAYVVDARSASSLRLLAGAGKSFRLPAYPTIPGFQEPYNVGAWYYTEWSSTEQFLSQSAQTTYGRPDWWGGVRDHVAGQDPWGTCVDYSAREPLLGFYDLNDQSIMDAHIRQAASAGLTFFAFYWYWNTELNAEDSATVPISTFLTSPLKASMRFVLAPIALGEADMSLAMWRDHVVPRMVDRYLSDPSYLKTADGRPIVILFDPSFATVADTVKGVAALRKATKARVGRDPFVLWLYAGESATDLANTDVGYRLEGLACFQLSPAFPAEPYATTAARWTRWTERMDGDFHLPCASTGLDRRPWWRMTWGTAGRGVNDEPFNTDIGVATFTAHLETVKRYLDRHPKSTARTFIVYAWNEWGEGGIIEPSKSLGYAYLDALTSVFGLRPRLER